MTYLVTFTNRDAAEVYLAQRGCDILAPVPSTNDDHYLNPVSGTFAVLTHDHDHDTRHSYTLRVYNAPSN